MKTFVSVAFVACWAVIACGGAQKTSAVQSGAMPTAPAGSAETAPMPGDRRDEIDQLVKAIDDELARGGVATLAPASCGTECTPEPYDVRPRVEDPTCKAPTTDTCTQSCTLSDSVCENAGKICNIAKQLGGADAYANEKCQSGNDACKRTREKCCDC